MTNYEIYLALDKKFNAELENIEGNNLGAKNTHITALRENFIKKYNLVKVSNMRKNKLISSKEMQANYIRFGSTVGSDKMFYLEVEQVKNCLGLNS